MRLWTGASIEYSTQHESSSNRERVCEREYMPKALKISNTKPGVDRAGYTLSQGPKGWYSVISRAGTRFSGETVLWDPCQGGLMLAFLFYDPDP